MISTLERKVLAPRVSFFLQSWNISRSKLISLVVHPLPLMGYTRSNCLSPSSNIPFFNTTPPLKCWDQKQNPYLFNKHASIQKNVQIIQKIYQCYGESCVDCVSLFLNRFQKPQTPTSPIQFHLLSFSSSSDREYLDCTNVPYLTCPLQYNLDWQTWKFKPWFYLPEELQPSIDIQQHRNSSPAS